MVLLSKQMSKSSQGNTEAEPTNAVLGVCSGGDYERETKFYYYGLLTTSKISYWDASVPFRHTLVRCWQFGKCSEKSYKHNFNNRSERKKTS